MADLVAEMGRRRDFGAVSTALAKCSNRWGLLDIADVAVFLASDAARNIAGTLVIAEMADEGLRVSLRKL